MRVYICVNERRGVPVLLVKATRAKWARLVAERASGISCCWYCIRVAGVRIDSEVVEAAPELLVNAELSPPPGMYWVPRGVKERLEELAAQAQAVASRCVMA